MNDKLSIGQKVYVEGIGNRIGYGMHEAIITQLGRKYFRVNNLPWERFIIDKLINNGGGYSPDYRVWLSLGEFNMEKEKRELIYYLEHYFDRYKNRSLTIEQMKRIKDIIVEC